MSAAEPRLFDTSKVERLFHGTLGGLDGPPRPGGYDQVWWTAETSAVAQCYIPATGGTTYVSVSAYELDQGVRPSPTSPLYALACELGPAATGVEVDGQGRVRSWRMPAGYLTNREVVRHIEDVLGYKNRGIGGDCAYELRTLGWDPVRGAKVVAAEYKAPGSLVIVTGGFEAMRLYDASTGESDLTDLQYHRTELFRQLKGAGYDGVVIDDFCQSKTWGNVGHRSVGFFAPAIERLVLEVVPAVRFDWGESRQDLQVVDTPEYAAWLAAGGAMRPYEERQRMERVRAA